MASIELSKKVEVQEDSRFRLKIWVSKTSANIPPQVFLFERLNDVPKQAVPLDCYSRVCTYADMLNYPATDPHTYSPYYRVYYIDRLYTSYNTLNTFWESIQTDVEALLNDIVNTSKADSVKETYTY